MFKYFKFFGLENFLGSDLINICLKYQSIFQETQNIQRTESDGELGTQDNDGRVTNAENLGDLSQSIRDQSSQCKVSISKPKC